MTTQKTHEELWKKEAMRLGGEALVEIIQEIRDDLAKIISKLNEIEEQNKLRDTSIASLKDAFPANDYGGHRRYHEILIASLEERRKLRIAIQEKTISGLIWAGIILLATSLWEYAKGKIIGAS